MEFVTFLIAIVATMTLTALLLKQKDFLRVFAVGPYMFFVFFVYAVNADPTLSLNTNEQLLASVNTNSTTTDRIYAFNVETLTTNSANINDGGAPASVRAEFVSSTSSMLYNKVIECISIPIKKLGSPPVGTLITVGTFDNSGILVKQFGDSMNVTSLTTATTWYDFCLPTNELYTIALSDRIGITYNAGDGSNKIDVGIDDTNPFDGTVTYRQTYTTTWASATNGDMTMKFYRGQNMTSSSVENTYVAVDPVTYTISPTTLTILNTLALIGAFLVVLMGYRGIIAGNKALKSKG